MHVSQCGNDVTIEVSIQSSSLCLGTLITKEKRRHISNLKQVDYNVTVEASRICASLLLQTCLLVFVWQQ